MMQFAHILAISGLTAFAIAAPAPGPVVTAAPAEITAAPVVARQQQTCWAGVCGDPCSFVPTTADGSTASSSACACGTFTTAIPQTIISNKPMLVCGGTTSPNPAPSEFSAQPLVSAPAQVAFGDFNPTGLISAISASCSNGCAATTTTLTTAQTIPNPSGGYNPQATDIEIEYVVSTEFMPSDQFSVFIAGLETLLTGSSTNETFGYDSGCPEPIGCISHHYTHTNYYAPKNIQFSRFTQDNTGSYSDNAGVFGVSITSAVVSTDNSALCSHIEGPIAAALGFIPGFGPAFGVIGSVICDLFI